MQIFLVLIYLVAIVAANLSVAYFGPAAVVIDAFLLISLDLTARDRLHEMWHGRYLWLKMAGLIGAGSLLSYALNRSAGRIAVASFTAFACAGTADTLVYHLLRGQTWRVKVNGSNTVSAAVDSLIFPTVAFGALLPLAIAGQFAAKVLGGSIWAYILGRRD